jgi:hypothetical protein
MTDFLVESNRDQVLRYVWKGRHKQCVWSESETSRFDVGTARREAKGTALIPDQLEDERERGKI